MACCAEQPTLLTELKDLVNQIGDTCCGSPPPPCPQPCYTPCTVPFAEVIMTCPPPIMVPTRPEPVKPLQLPCPCLPDVRLEPLTSDEMERARYDNFYNNYNVDWHSENTRGGEMNPCCTSQCSKKNQQRVCEDYTKNAQDECTPAPGCPTGFKPCSMKLTSPPNCHPYGVWCAQVQPCPPKPKKKSGKYEPGPCRRPCCKHWEPKEGPCLYDDPCKAHCYNHPPGMKPSGRWP